MVAKNFNVYFADRQFNIKGMASTAVPFALQIFDDRETEKVDTDTSKLSLSIEYPKGYEIDPVLDVGFYILYQDEDGISKFFTVIDYEKFAAERLIEVTGESGNLDLLNSVALPYKADKAYPISHYINKFASDSGFEIGVNEVEHLTRKLEWEGQDTATKRVLSVCTQFDNTELEHSFEVIGMTVTKRMINLYKKRGKDTGETLRLYRELNEITTSKSIRNIATGLWATGGTPEGKDEPVNLKGHIYDDGRFYVEDGYLLDRQSFAIWNRYGASTEISNISKHIIKSYSHEKALTQTELRNRAISELTKLAEVDLNFTVDIAVLPKGIRVGDRINIASVDDSLFLGARVLQMEKSRSGKKNVATLGEYLIKHSGITQRVKDMAEQIGSMKDGDSSFLWVRYADDDSGKGISASPTNKKYVAVKSVVNNSVPSDDPADYKGLWRKFVGESGIDGSDKYTWIRYADTVSGTGISASPTGKKYIGFAYNKDTANASNTPADYQWFLAKGEDGQKGKDGADGVPGKQGADGKTLYTWMKYADDASGNGISNVGTGKKYIGFAYNKETAVESVNPKDYEWTLVKGEQGIAGGKGADGKTLYTWIKYSANANGNGMTEQPQTNTKYIGIAVGKESATESNVITDYTWSKFVGDNGKDGVNGAPGVAGKPGVDGKTTYTWIKYADNASGSGISDNPTNKKYIGMAYNKLTATESVTPTDYTWALIQGADGKAGTNGVDGKPKYTWVRYSPNANGSGMTSAPAVTTKYIGIAVNKDTSTPSANATDYQWSKFVGEDGKNGANGTQGATTYFYCAWADSADGKTGFTINSSQSGNKGYLGTYSSTSATQSSVSTSYAWVKLAGAFSKEVDEIKARINSVKEIAHEILAPKSPKKGDLWWQLDPKGTNKVIAFKEWDGSKWAPSIIAQEVLNIVELNAVNITGSVVTGSSVVSFFNDVPIGGMGPNTTKNPKVSGTATMSAGKFRIEFAVTDNDGVPEYKNSYGYVEAGVTGFHARWAKSDGDNLAVMQLSLQGMFSLSSQDATGNLIGGNISARNLEKVPWVNLPLRSGYAVAESNPPQYKITYNLDGTRTISYRGQYKLASGKMPAGSDQYPILLPAHIRPEATEMFYGPIDGGTGSNVYIATTGRVGTVIGSGAAGYVALSTVTYQLTK